MARCGNVHDLRPLRMKLTHKFANEGNKLTLVNPALARGVRQFISFRAWLHMHTMMHLHQTAMMQINLSTGSSFRSRGTRKRRRYLVARKNGPTAQPAVHCGARRGSLLRASPQAKASPYYSCYFLKSSLSKTANCS